MSPLKDFNANLTQETRQKMQIKAKETREANKLWAEQGI